MIFARRRIDVALGQWTEQYLLARDQRAVKLTVRVRRPVGGGVAVAAILQCTEEAEQFFNPNYEQDGILVEEGFTSIVFPDGVTGWRFRPEATALQLDFVAF